MPKSYCWLRSFVCLVLGGAIAPANAGEGNLPTELQTALRQNVAELAPITVSWTQEADMPRSPAAVAADLQVRATMFSSQKGGLVWDNGKIYGWTRGPKGALSEQSFDGKVLYIGNPDAKRPDGGASATLTKQSIQKTAEQDPGTEWLPTLYFHRLGVRLPSSSEELLKGDAVSEPLWLLNRGAALVSVQDVELQGRKAVRLQISAEDPLREFAEGTTSEAIRAKLKGSRATTREIEREVQTVQQWKALPKRTYVFFLDPALHYAVRQREEWQGNNLAARAINDQFKKLDGRNIWFPHFSKQDHHTWVSVPGKYSKEPFFSWVLKIDALSTDAVSSDRFVLDYKMPGTQVFDSTVPGRLPYVIPAGTSELDEALTQTHPVLAEWYQNDAVLWGIVIAVNVVILAGVWGWAARKKHLPARRAHGPR